MSLLKSNNYKNILLALSFFVITACANQPVNRVSTTPLTAAPSIDVDQYLGRWYEIARLPNSFEKDCDGVTADYTWRDDGLIAVTNTCRKGSPSGKIKVANGKARLVDKTTNSKLEVSFFGPFWGDYWILDIADDYSISLVGEPSGKYLWILAREPKLSDQEKADVLSKLTAFGYDVTALYFPAQPPVPDNPHPE